MSQYITKNPSNSAKKKRQSDAQKEKIINNLRYENQILHNILENIPGNVFWVNTDNVYIGCNLSHAKNVGASSPEEVIGKRNQDFMSEEDARTIDETNKQIIASGKEIYLEEKGIDSNMESAIYLTRKSILYDLEGKCIGLIGASFNITDRKRMEHELRIAKEKAEASDKAKTQFLAMMNHELNTPLASIIGLVNLIKDGDLPREEEKNIIDTIENCTEHLLDLVNEVLDFSRLENNNPVLRKTAVDINDLLSEVYGLLQIAANNKNLELKVQFVNEIHHAILTDRRILLQILINLVNNAIKFTDKGQIVIEVNASVRKNTMLVELDVIDTGSGIPADKLDLIFEPFKQLDHHYTRQSSRHGTGLGLAIVKKLLSQLGMEISVKSTPGLGSTFTIKGEFEITDAKATTRTSHALRTKLLTPKKPVRKKIPHPSIREFRVLLVEDDPIIQFIHKKMLEEYKCEIDIAGNGRDGTRMFNEHDIVFVDLTLPDINGFEVIKSLRKKTKVPIIALTAHTGEIERRDSLKAGANKFETKPISREKLRKILVHYVEKK